MLNWSMAFFVIAILCAVLGFSGILPDPKAVPHIEQVCRDVVVWTGGGSGPEACKILFVVFVVLFLVTLVAGLLQRP